MSNPFVPITMADLRDTLLDLPSDKQHYLSFIEGNNLPDRWKEIDPATTDFFYIAELNFNAGLNFLFTWHLWEQCAPPKARLRFIANAQHPLKIDDLKSYLRLWPDLADYSKQLIDNYPVLTPGYHQLHFANGRVQLTLMLGDSFENFEQLLICGESSLEAKVRTNFIDAWYLNDVNHFENNKLPVVIKMLSAKATTFASCIGTHLIVPLQDLGFTVENQGEWSKGYRKQEVSCRLKTRHSPWHLNSINKPKKKSALIIGAGLASAFTAHSLAKRGWNVTIIEESPGAGQGGSGNEQAILFPKLSAYKSPLTQFMLTAFLYANQTYRKILKHLDCGELKGALLLAYNEREKKAQASLHHWLIHYPELGQLVNAQKGSDLSGLRVEQSGLFIPLSGWINSPVLCQHLLSDKKITLLTHQKVEEFYWENDHWIVNNNHAPVLILANGAKVHCFKETKHLPVKALRGQMTAIAANPSSSKLLIPLCADGHVLPALEGSHRCGATYELNVDQALIYDNDDKINRDKLSSIAAEDIWSKEIISHWAGVRASPPDYLPLVGQLPKVEEFLALYAGLASNSKRWIAQAGPYYPGLFLCAGFGSRGLTTIPLSAEWLAASINGELSCLSRSLVQAIAPSRFLHRNISRGLV